MKYNVNGKTQDDYWKIEGNLIGKAQTMNEVDSTNMYE